MKEPTILVVDDNLDLLNTFALILRLKGFNVDTAGDGESAVDKFRDRRHDVVLMDIIMPGMTGIEAFRAMMEIDPDARVILMTAYYEPEEIASALDKGAFSAVQKPVEVARLINLINEATTDPFILIVDDDEEFSRTMARILEIKGFKVDTAGSAEAAAKIAREKKCGMAFIDVKMPLLNGLQAYLMLREINPELIAIMMTGYRNEANDIISQALASRAAGCLYKPFNADEVIALAGRIKGTRNREKKHAPAGQHITSR